MTAEDPRALCLAPQPDAVQRMRAMQHVKKLIGARDAHLLSKFLVPFVWEEARILVNAPLQSLEKRVKHGGAPGPHEKYRNICTYETCIPRRRSGRTGIIPDGFKRAPAVSRRAAQESETP